MKTKCYSVRLESLVSISEKAYKAIAFDGSEAIIPKSCMLGFDCDVHKSEAYWIAAWILEKKTLQHSTKKIGWFNPATCRVEPHIQITIETHVPKRIEPVNITADDSLTR